MQKYTNEQAVDLLAEVLAEKAELEKLEKELKLHLISSDLKNVEGTLHKATITLMPGRESLDRKGLFDFLKVPTQVVARFTRHGDPFYTVRIFSK